MLSAHRRFPARSHLWRLLYAAIALAIAAGTSASTASAQSFTLYDPNISMSPQTVVSATLDELLVAGSYITADGAQFSAFQFSGIGLGGAANPSAADIVITAPVSASPQLMFQDARLEAFGAQSLDVSLKFDVTELNSLQKIMTAELNYTGGTGLSGGTVSVTEDVDDMNNNLLAEGTYAEQPGFPGSANAGTLTFAGQQEIQVSKDISLYGTNSTDTESISNFTQTFDATTPAVPEPSSIVMAMFGSGGLGWFGWRRRAKRRKLTTRNTASELQYQFA